MDKLLEEGLNLQNHGVKLGKYANKVTKIKSF